MHLDFGDIRSGSRDPIEEPPLTTDERPEREEETR